MSQQFLPGFELAPPHNRLLVTHPDRYGAPEFFHGEPNKDDLRRAEVSLDVRQRVARFLGDGVIGMAQESLPVSGWDNLKQSTNTWLANHIMSRTLDDFRSVCHVTTADEAKAEILSAGKEGVATITAFLKVIPSVLSRDFLIKPSEEIVEAASRSKGFIIAWSNLSGACDRALAYALASPKPTSMARIFYNLHFDPVWFCSRNGRIALDPALVRNLRSHRGVRPSIDPNLGPIASFGCPARRMIPGLYDMMVAEADKAGLFEQTYWQERRSNGYTDAETALDNFVVNNTIMQDL